MGKTSKSKWTIIIALYIIEFALIFFTNGDYLALLALVCAIIGWRAITMVQPSMFIWMPLVGWIIYVVVKFFIAYFVGLFLAPYTIGNKIADIFNINE